MSRRRDGGGGLVGQKFELTFDPGVSARMDGDVENARRAIEPEAREVKESIAGEEEGGTLVEVNSH